MTEHNSLAAALCAAQAEMPNAVLDKKNPHFGNKYASLESLRDASLKVLAKHGLSISFEMDMDEIRGLYLRAVLSHDKTDEKRFSFFPLPNAPDKPQVIKSAVTYGTRTTWAGLVAIAAEEDDDGERASAGDKGSGKGKSALQARKDGFYAIAQETIRGIASLDALKDYWRQNQDEIRAMPPRWRELLDEEKDRRKLELVDELGLSQSPLVDDLKKSLKLTDEEAEVIDPIEDAEIAAVAYLDNIDSMMAGANDEITLKEIKEENFGILEHLSQADQDKAEFIFQRHYRRIQADAAVKAVRKPK